MASETLPAPAAFEPGSFRDPGNRVLLHRGEVYRLLDERSLQNWQQLGKSELYRRFGGAGRLVASERLTPAELPVELEPFLERWAGVLRHARIPVVSYPYEWPFGMLQEAARLQLDLLDAALAEGLTLKDATPYNVQWVGTRPQFIDVGSFEPWRQGEVWVGYRQFCQLYLFPLMLRAYKNVPYQPLLRGSLDGIEPGDFAALMSKRDLLRPGVLLHGYLQARLLARYGRSDRNVKHELRRGGFSQQMIRANVNRLRRLVDRIAWRQRRSEWSAYTEEWTYDETSLDRKRRRVGEALAAIRPQRVWDLGANTGLFARLAAEQAEYVIALDGDELAVESLYQELVREGEERILPLVVNLCQPSPGLGWRGRERLPLELRDRPDAVLCLALVHHLTITGNLPFSELLDWLAELRAHLVIEFPERHDPMVERLLRNRSESHEGYRRERFEAQLAERFEIVSSAVLSATRHLYHAAPRS